MKITSTILSIPPYISTTWKNISAIHLNEQSILTITLQNQAEIKIPNLSRPFIDEIFEAHAKATQEENPLNLFSENLGSVSTLGPAMEHNPSQSTLPELPPTILSKITSIVTALGIAETSELPPAEENCNCMYCQVRRSLSQEEPLAMEVSDEDLTFRDWEVRPISDKLYQVTHPLDTAEQYSVFLGDPLGCTCGSKDCEHIRAALKS